MQMANDHRPGCLSLGKVRRIPSSRTILEAWSGKHQSTWSWEKGCLAGTWGWIATMWKERIVHKKWTWPLTPIWESLRNKCYNGKNTYKVLYSSFLFYPIFYFIYPVIYFTLFFPVILFYFIPVILFIQLLILFCIFQLFIPVCGGDYCC